VVRSAGAGERVKIELASFRSLFSLLEVAFGEAYVVYPEAFAERCTAALILHPIRRRPATTVPHRQPHPIHLSPVPVLPSPNSHS
jgi:hypothetical protein